MKPDPSSESVVAHGELAGTRYGVHAPKSAPARATVVLIHGVGMNQSVWTPQIEALTAARYEVVVYDMLGHGASALPPAEPTLEDYAGQLERLFDGLELRTAHVAGHSMGALVALEFALTRASRTLSVAALNAVYARTPSQRAAVMARAALLQDGRDAAVEANETNEANEAAEATEATASAIDATLARWFGDPVPAPLAAAAQTVRELLRTVNPHGYARTYRLFAAADEAHVGRLAQLAVPALFLTGECDPNSSPAMSRAMAAAAPLGRADVIAHARHMMNLSDADAVNARLLAFFDAAARPGADNPNASNAASESSAANESSAGERHV
ncbi:alpha/beta fold hydrolase [Paraburkholderia acidisoli]|uniref:Alpha/beta fold hydrolase n=1 Tax=Paraburkholderia acidisoli TaxID=2571748 RepID=A0A7Z2GMY9_9BURK|nr:alpha/beta fold hydrolase [Paraburkholderia acidisoli]QGZ64771.1 alpha/beta fold hydrolase [Paraburkholderia acidisoli]